MVSGMGSGAIDAELNTYPLNTLLRAILTGCTIFSDTSGSIVMTFVLVHGEQKWRLDYGV